MQDFSVVNVLESKADLRKPVHNLCFLERSSALLFYQSREISVVCVFHHNVQELLSWAPALAGSVDFEELLVRDDVRVVELGQKANFL